MGFLELRRQCGVSHEVRRGAQGASLMAPGKSGLHVRGEGVHVISIEHATCGMKELQELFSEHNPESIPIQFFLKDNSDGWYLRGASTEMCEHSLSIGFLNFLLYWFLSFQR